MAASLEVNKMLAAVLTAGIIASGAGVISRIIYHHPQMPAEHAYPIEIAAIEGEAADTEGAAPTVSLAALLADGSVERGETSAKKCAACHTFGEGEPNKIGPHLWGVLGRDIAAVADFSYSAALAGQEGSWDYDKLNAFLAEPKAFAPGTKMAFAGLKKPEERADMILYLRSLAASLAPLPEAPAEATEPAEEERADQEQTGEEPADEQPAGQMQTGEAAGQEQTEEAAGQEQTEEAAGQEPAGQQQAATAGGGGLAALLAAADPAAGEKAAKKCLACHSFAAGGPNKIGPALHGVVGRDIASVDGFSYSAALQGKEGAWDYQTLDEYLTSPKAWAPGTKMAFAGLKKPEERAEVIAFLRSVTDNPPPLPGDG